MKVYKPIYNVVLREVPGEISVGFMVAGCKQGCKDCSYKSLEKFGTEELDLAKFEAILKKNDGLATCALFMGGEWDGELAHFLSLAKGLGYKTCLFTGMKSLDDITPDISCKLDFCKTGRWEGIPLTDVKTNQKFWDVKNKAELTYKFQQKKVVE